MRRIALSFSFFFLVLSFGLFAFVAADSGEPDIPLTPDKPGWQLTFCDEFDTETLDETKWYPAYRQGSIDYRAAQANAKPYVSNANYVIEDGILKLRIDEKLPRRGDLHAPCVSSIQTSDFQYDKETSRFTVHDKFAQKHGLFEIRCRMPKGSGLHSAFWLLQTDPEKQENTPGGKRRGPEAGVVEIDIFETLGRCVATERENWFNVHFTKDGHFKYKMNFDVSEGFHVWMLQWKEGTLIWYLDGRAIRTYVHETPREKMGILLGLYQGSNWVGPVDKDMPYPRDFEIDYVRVYQKAEPRK